MTSIVERTDEDIVREVQRGNQESYRELVERYEAKITRYAKKFFFSGDEGKDLVQDVFIKAYVNIQSFDVNRRFSPWLYRIAHNEFINAIKKRQKEKDTVSTFDFDVLFPALIAKESSDEDLTKHELRQMLDGCLDKLDVKYREPLVLYFFEEMDYKGIAEVLHIPISTVGVRLQRGKAMLKKLVKT